MEKAGAKAPEGVGRTERSADFRAAKNVAREGASEKVGAKLEAKLRIKFGNGLILSHLFL